MGNLQILSEPRELSSPEKRQLVKKLLACPVINDRASRETVLQQLSSQIVQAVSRNSADLIDVMNIMATCLKHRDGLQELVETVEFFEGNSLPMEHLIRFLQTLF